MKLNCDISTKVIKELQAQNIKCYIVGGYVRDSLLGLQPKDIDIELHHTDVETAYRIISEITDAKIFGSFGVISLTNANTEFAIARTEVKNGVSHTNFDIKFITNGDLKLAASRRDFTINSIMYDLQSNQIIDNYNGQIDLENKLLRHVSSAFSEDPLRVLRGLKFIARYDLKIDTQTDKLCRTIINELHHLPTSRIESEVKAIFNAEHSQAALPLLTTYLQLLFNLNLQSYEFSANKLLNKINFFRQFDDYQQVLDFCFEQKKLKKDLKFVIENYHNITNYHKLDGQTKYILHKEGQYVIDYLIAINPNLEKSHNYYLYLIETYNGQYFINQGYCGKQIASQQIKKIGGLLNELSN